MKKCLLAVLAFIPSLFTIAGTAAGAQESVLYDFFPTGNAFDGEIPSGRLVFDKAGNLYGTTRFGGTGANPDGTVYQLTPPTEVGGEWKEATLYSFQSGADGENPIGYLVFDSKGNLYGISEGGTTSAGGAAGVLYELSPPAKSGGIWTFQVLYAFPGSNETADCGVPQSLIGDGKGNLFGNCSQGGANSAGGVFELSPPTKAGGKWTEKLISSFPSSDDGWISTNQGNLIFDAKGNLYGTSGFGSNGFGAVYELSPSAGAEWTFIDLAEMTSANYAPSGPLAMDKSGNLYGTAGGNGINGGSVFELSPGKPGAPWTVQVVHAFKNNASDGGAPMAGVIFDGEGNLYGVTSEGGPYYTNNKANTNGALFELSPVAGSWKEQIIHFFDGKDGDVVSPASPLIADSKGRFYGVGGGGANQEGAAYEYAPVPTATTPTFSPVPGIYATEQKVTIKTATPGSTIYYTTNGAAPTTSSAKFETAIEASKSETIQAIAVATGFNPSAVASAQYFIGKPAATPVIAPAAGTYRTDAMVKITDATAGATIHYTISGLVPTASSPKYTGVFKLKASATVKAIAIGSDGVPSKVASVVYVIQAAPPVFSLKSGQYAKAQTVTITDTTPGAVIYYTTNKSVPTAASKRYTAAIAVTASETLKAIAIAKGESASGVTTAVYNIGTN